MNILITGSGGMLGQVLSPCLRTRGHKVFDYAKEKLDVTNFKQVQSTLSSIDRLELVIHCAAYTKVDLAESESKLAYLVNGYGTENLAIICNKLGIPLLYPSTDYVFDGEQDKPYTTWDFPHPLSIYGKSKLAGEIAVQRHLDRFYIVRTSWLYGPHGKNFVETILSMAGQGNPLKIVCDQIGSPTYTLSLSDMIADLIETERWGIYHATDDGVTNWFEFAREITKDLAVEITPIATGEMPRPATRPKYSVLDKTILISTIGRQLPTWQNSLHSYLQLRAAKEPAQQR
jgi:dTDP-4-dehydrorhamnose reductase